MSATLIDQAAFRARRSRIEKALTFVEADGRESAYNYPAFFKEAANYAAALENAGIKAGDLVVLVMEQSIDVMAAFWGAILMGAVPSIFPFLNEKLDAEHYYTSIRQLIGFEGVRAVVAFQKFEADLRAALAGVDVDVITDDSLNGDGDVEVYFARPRPDPDATAFLQHSSGSTGLQKGVMLSHRAVLNQVSTYGDEFYLRPGGVIVSWLPLYHDMGLIAAFILPIVRGMPLVVMSPFEWVRQPAMLLHAITRHRARYVWLPNFAYNFMATRIRESALEGVDLSSLDMVINCSEPVYAESHRAFVKRFAPYGLNAAALKVCYAMAENTFAVTQTLYEDDAPRIDVVDRRRFAEDKIAVNAEGDAPRMEIVSCGVPLSNTEVRIVGADGDVLPDRHVGEIEIRSDCMLTGYYKRDDLQPFHDGWFMTGDMGYLADGELYVTGRKKDLIIVAGKNVYPQDIENLLNDVPGVYPGRVVAFGVPNAQLGTEDIAVLVEGESDAVPEDDERRGEIVREVRARIATNTEVTARYVEVLPPRQLIKTSSGKIARSANRERFLEQLTDA